MNLYTTKNFLMNYTQHDGPLNNFYHHYLNGLYNDSNHEPFITVQSPHCEPRGDRSGPVQEM